MVKAQLKTQFILFVLGIFFSMNAKSQSPSVLNAGSYMTAGQKIISPNSVYTCIFQGDGNLVVYKNMKDVIWNTRTVGKIITKCVLQFDGNMVLYSGDVAKWNSKSAGGCFPPYWIQMQNDGNLVIYDGKNVAIWSSMHGATDAEKHMACPIQGTTSIGAVLEAGTKMILGQKLVSTDGIYSCVLQGDGNLVVYEFGQRAIWNSKTTGSQKSYCVMQNDGNFVLYDNGTAKWSSQTYGGKFPPYRIQMQNDGNLVIYNGRNQATWSSMTGSTLSENPPIQKNGVSFGNLYQFETICAGSPIPQGWIQINDEWNPTACGNPTSIVYNLITIERYDIIPIGLSINVCANAPTPSGWSMQSTTWNPLGCGHPVTNVKNEKIIKRVN